MKKRLASFAAGSFLILLFLFVFTVSASAGGGVSPGYRFLFGTFEQDTLSVDGAEPIVWRVLETDEAGGRVLAVSEFGLYTMKYNRTNNKTAWGDTDVRSWLNGPFLASFSEQERAAILPAQVSGSRDYFFLLDEGQVVRYLSQPYLCYATPYALLYGEEGAYVNEDTGASSWLVRTDTAGKRIAWVGGGGVLYSPSGKKGVNYQTSKDNVVRPAMWLSLDAVGDEVTSFGFPLYAKTKMRISTRSGPTTGYNGLGDYFEGGGHLVRVLSRVNDGSIWWLQIEFEYNGVLVRCYTGLKRVEISIGRVPDEIPQFLGTGTVLDGSGAAYGPGTYYKKQPDKLVPPAGTTGSVIAQENGWYCLEYDRGSELSRVWLPASALEIR